MSKSEGEITGGMVAFGIGRAEAKTVSYLGYGVYASMWIGELHLRTREGHHIALTRCEIDALNRYAEGKL